MEGGDIGTKKGDDSFVGIFSLAVGLRVVSSRHVEGGTGEGGEGFPEVGSESGVTVRDDGRGPPVEAIDMIVEDTSNTGGGDGFGGGYDMDELGEAANEDDKGVVSTGGEREVSDKVHGNGFPRGYGDGEGLQKAGGGGGSTVFIGLARKALSNILPYLVGKTGPIKMTGKTVDCFGSSLVARDWDIVGLLEERRAEMRGDVEAVGGGVKEPINDGKIIPAASLNLPEKLLVSGVGRCLVPYSST